MATGTKTYTISKNVPPSDNVTSVTGGGVLITADTTYSIPSGTTYSRVKVTKASTSSKLQFGWRTNTNYTAYSWNTWYSSSDVAKSKFVNPDSNKPQIFVKNTSSSYINTNFTITVEYTYPNRTITVNAGMTATANTGYTFNKWTTTGGTLASSTSASTTLTMPDANVTVTASFTKISRTITVNAGTGGTASANKATAGYNDSVTLTATPNTGYSFDKWTTTGGTLASATSASTTLTMPNANVTVTASFTHVLYNITTGISPSGGGDISVSSNTGYYNDQITLTATPSDGYQFSSWSTDPSVTITSNTFNMPNGNISVTANFTKIDYTINSSVSPAGAGTVTLGAQTANIGDVITISATPASGYAFSGWSATAGTITDSSSASTTFTVPASNVTITATFVLDSVAISFSVFPTGTGTLTKFPDSESYAGGTQVTVTATPASGYRFNRWLYSDGYFVDALAAQTTYIVPSTSANVVAYFTQTSPTYTNSGIYNGSTYDPVQPFYYDGTNWIPVELKRYNGSSWDDITSY